MKKRTVSLQRSDLRNETIGLLICLKSRFRLGIFTEEDLHAIFATLDEYLEAIEAMEEAAEAVEAVEAV